MTKKKEDKELLEKKIEENIFFFVIKKNCCFKKRKEEKQRLSKKNNRLRAKKGLSFCLIFSLIELRTIVYRNYLMKLYKKFKNIFFSYFPLCC